MMLRGGTQSAQWKKKLPCELRALPGAFDTPHGTAEGSNVSRHSIQDFGVLFLMNLLVYLSSFEALKYTAAYFLFAMYSLM